MASAATSSQDFRNFVNAHNDTVGFQKHAKYASFQQSKTSTWEIFKTCEEQLILTLYQLIKQEERETGNTGLQPYILCLSQSKGFLSLLGSYMPLHILSYAVDTKLLLKGKCLSMQHANSRVNSEYGESHDSSKTVCASTSLNASDHPRDKYLHLDGVQGQVEPIASGHHLDHVILFVEFRNQNVSHQQLNEKAPVYS
ncbi:abc transporter c family member 10 [Quercus suber]|uniref:Abc transporter c family member 10 n=1 Tax=Quercus suber TaxID=58331 RepID=A0AAW0LR96_QUESU